MPARLPTLRNRLATTFALLFFALAALLAVFAGNQASREIEIDTGASLSDTAVQIADKLDRELWSRKQTVVLLATLDVLREPGDVGRLRELVDNIKQSFDVTAWVGFTGTDGKVIAASDRLLEGVDLTQRPVFINGIKGEFVGDVHDAVMLARSLPNPSGEPMKFVDLATPVEGRDGNVVGTLGVHLSWDWARQIQASVLSPQLNGRKVEGFVIATDGTVLLGSRALLGTKLDLPAIDAARETRAPGYREEIWPDGKAYLTGYALGTGYLDFQGLGWVTLVRQPADQALGHAFRLRRTILQLAIGFSLVFAAAGWLAAGWLAGPLVRIAAAADRIRAGDANAVIPDDARVREVHVLARSLRGLVASLTDGETALSRMETKAYRDALTGLPNRAEFQRSVLALAARGDPAKGFACLYLDLDRFKPINDTHGHAFGDLVLQEVGVRLREALRGHDFVARLGGDEFVLVLPGESATVRDLALAVAERVIATIGRPMSLAGGVVVEIGCSIGIAVWPEDAMTVPELLGHADDALYQAKRGGRNRAVCTPSPEFPHDPPPAAPS